MKIPEPVLNWLLEGEPWVEYQARLSLLHQPEDHPQVISARRAMLAHPLVQALVTGLADWPGKVISSHKSAGQPFHRLTFLADLGLRSTDPGMEPLIQRVLEHRSAEGPFQLPTNIPTHFGGTGMDTWAWALCDAPLSLYALARFGLTDDPALRKVARYLVELVQPNGWPCAVSPELGNFRGPGRKGDPCPFATLVMLKALGIMPEYQDGLACHAGAESLLTLWAESLIRHPYIFYMGTDFRKLKAPFIWYDLLHVLEVLSQFDWVLGDPRFIEMVRLLQCKADPTGRYTIESVWAAWKGWDFGQKKEPSRWLTLLARRIFERVKEK